MVNHYCGRGEDEVEFLSQQVLMCLICKCTICQWFLITFNCEKAYKKVTWNLNMQISIGQRIGVGWYEK